MLRILNIEWLKIKHSKAFWIMFGLFALCYTLTGILSKTVIDFMINKGPKEMRSFLDTGLPIFDFADIWHNLAYLGGLFKWILAFIIIISITNEFSFRTIRQHIIDGLSKAQFLQTKLSLIVALSLINVILIFILGLVLGLLYAPVHHFSDIFQNIVYLPLVFVEIIGFLCLAMLFAIIIRKTGFTLVLFTLYTLFIENFITAYFYYNLKWPIWYFPFRSVNNLIHFPFSKYVLQYVPSGFIVGEFVLACLWTLIFIYLSALIIKKKDL